MSDRLLRFVSRLQRLEAFPRSGWLVSGVRDPESVAAHSYEVAVIAMWIADEIPDEVDVERVLRIALLHDIGESMTMDIPAPIKTRLGKEEVQRAELEAASDVLAEAPGPWANDVREYADRSSLEARIVKGADQIQMLCRALAYEQQGAGDLRRFWDRDDDDHGVPFVGDVLRDLRKRRSDEGWHPADFD